MLSIINNSVLVEAGWRPEGGRETCVNELKQHEKFIKERSIRMEPSAVHEEQIAADSFHLLLTEESCIQKQKMVHQRWRDASNRYGRLPVWIIPLLLLIRLIQRSVPIMNHCTSAGRRAFPSSSSLSCGGGSAGKWRLAPLCQD